METETIPLTLPTMELSDGELRLRAWAAVDSELRIEAGSDPDILRFTSVPGHPSPADAAEWIAQREPEQAAGQSVFFVMCTPIEARALGSASLFDVSPTHRSAEVGYWLRRDARGHGFAERALRLLIEYAFQHTAIVRLNLLTNLDNEGSIATAERCGFTREGLLRSYRANRGTREDLYHFGLVKPDQV